MAVILATFFFVSGVKVDRPIPLKDGGVASAKVDAGSPTTMPMMPMIERRALLLERLAIFRADVEKNEGPLKSFEIFWATQIIDDRDAAIVTFQVKETKMALAFFFAGNHWAALPEEFVK